MKKTLSVFQFKLLNLKYKRLLTSVIEDFAKIQRDKNQLVILKPKILGYNNAQRWFLLNALLNNANKTALNFLHIPKTGGTSFGESLAYDNHVDIVSVDASPDVFFTQLVQLVYQQGNEQEKPVLIRAHHSLLYSATFLTGNLPNLSFFSFRDPIDIHVSNVNMIMRRLKAFSDGVLQNEPERLFSERWLALLNGTFSANNDFAQKIIASKAYQQEMGGIYSRNFDSFDWENRLKSKQLFAIKAEDIDYVFFNAFGYTQLPARRNVSDVKWLAVSDLSEKNKCDLLGRDYRVVEKIKQHLCSGSEFSKALQRAFPSIKK